jgi:hypothetical protein
LAVRSLVIVRPVSSLRRLAAGASACPRSRRARLVDLLPPLAILVASVASVAGNATAIFPVGYFHGAGIGVRLGGAALGILGGARAWRAASVRLTTAAAAAIAIAVASVCSVIPAQLDQTLQLLHTYTAMPRPRAESAGSYQISSASGHEASFDVIRRQIPPDATYVLFADDPYAQWVHGWLLPRIAVTSPHEAEWAIVHGRTPRSVHVRLTHLRRIDDSTWIGEIVR